MLTSAHRIDTVPFHRAIALPRTGGRKLDAYFAEAHLRQLRAHDPLFAEGDIRSNVYRVETGAVLMYKILHDGVRQIVGFAFPGDYVALETSQHHTYDAHAVMPTRLRWLPSNVLWRDAAEDSALAKELFETVSHEVASLREHLLTIGRLSATRRVAAFLLELSRRNERKALDRINIMLPVCRGDIADFLCLSVETVSRSLTEMKQAQLITLRGWRQVKIVDRPALEKFASGEADAGLRNAA
jgi:CRP/FNR family transcriptional regulator